MGLSGRLNTAFIERAPLTVRHGVVALTRRTWATRSPPHNCWPTWNGGELTHMLCVPTHRCEWPSCSRESEVAS
jgi:hypothetical protein